MSSPRGEYEYFNVNEVLDDEEWECELVDGGDDDDDRVGIWWFWRWVMGLGALVVTAGFFYLIEWHKQRQKPMEKIEEKKEADLAQPQSERSTIAFEASAAAATVLQRSPLAEANKTTASITSEVNQKPDSFKSKQSNDITEVSINKSDSPIPISDSLIQPDQGKGAIKTETIDLRRRKNKNISAALENETSDIEIKEKPVNANLDEPKLPQSFIENSLSSNRDSFDVQSAAGKNQEKLSPDVEISTGEINFQKMGPSSDVEIKKPNRRPSPEEEMKIQGSRVQSRVSPERSGEEEEEGPPVPSAKQVQEAMAKQKIQVETTSADKSLDLKAGGMGESSVVAAKSETSGASDVERNNKASLLVDDNHDSKDDFSGGTSTSTTAPFAMPDSGGLFLDEFRPSEADNVSVASSHDAPSIHDSVSKDLPSPGGAQSAVPHHRLIGQSDSFQTQSAPEFSDDSSAIDSSAPSPRFQRSKGSPRTGDRQLDNIQHAPRGFNEDEESIYRPNRGPLVIPDVNQQQRSPDREIPQETTPQPHEMEGAESDVGLKQLTETLKSAMELPEKANHLLEVSADSGIMGGLGSSTSPSPIMESSLTVVPSDSAPQFDKYDDRLYDAPEETQEYAGYPSDELNDLGEPAAPSPAQRLVSVHSKRVLPEDAILPSPQRIAGEPSPMTPNEGTHQLPPGVTPPTTTTTEADVNGTEIELREENYTLNTEIIRMDSRGPSESPDRKPGDYLINEADIDVYGGRRSASSKVTGKLGSPGAPNKPTGKKNRLDRLNRSTDSQSIDSADSDQRIASFNGPSKMTREDSQSIKSDRSSLLDVMDAADTRDAISKVETLAEVSAVMREAGLEHSNLIFGIDYTASNKYQGDASFGGRSLHSINTDIPNPYQQVIDIMGRTLAPFATSGHIPVFGFGDVKTSDWSVFPLKEKGYCRTFDEVLRVYNKITPKVILSGPTNFAPLIYQSMEICKQMRGYHILVIVADGQVTNERATRRAIVDACKFPLSIVVVGVGDGPWEMMKVFDDSLPKRPWDNFHFVEFHKIVEQQSKPSVSFAMESLLEIPDQYKAIKAMGLLNFDDEPSDS